MGLRNSLRTSGNGVEFSVGLPASREEHRGRTRSNRVFGWSSLVIFRRRAADVGVVGQSDSLTSFR